VIVLDTHVLIWWVNGGEALSEPAQQAINRTVGSGAPLLVSSISAWEIAMLVSKGRLALTMEITRWLETVEAIEAVRFVPVDNALGVQSVQLPGELHPDPADRIIVALARRFSVPLVTADERIRAYKQVKTIW
jgi:PIN domain nuclease of toxin-antitoxin system